VTNDVDKDNEKLEDVVKNLSGNGAQTEQHTNGEDKGQYTNGHDKEEEIKYSEEDLRKLQARARAAAADMFTRSMGGRGYYEDEGTPEDGWSPSNGKKAKSEAPPKQFKIVLDKDIVVNFDEEYLVDDLLPQQGLAMIFGESMTYKSFCVVDLTKHISLGWPWGERRVVQGDVIYIAA
jgi:hypothetical protein